MTSTAGAFSIWTRCRRWAISDSPSTEPSQRDTAPDIPALDVSTQCAHRPSLLFWARPVRVCRART